MLRPTGPLSSQHGQLMTHGDQLNFQRGAAAKTEGKERNNGGENRPHDRDGTASRRKSPAFRCPVEQGQVHARA
jgi:hypothetical protein